MREFTRLCHSFIEDINGKYNFEVKDTLLWIYLNIYIFSLSKQGTSDYCKESFRTYIGRKKTMYLFFDKFNTIEAKDYKRLREMILERYVRGGDLGLASQDMEETYEELMEDSLKTKTGSYYTPQAVVKYMTNQSILSYIEARLDNSEESLRDYLEGKIDILTIDYILQAINIIEGIRIIDISCGGGAFLRQTLRTLFMLRSKLYKLIGKDLNPIEIKKEILEDNLFGIDIQKESILLCEILLMLEVKAAMEIKFNLFNNDALSMEFNKEFDIVIGNPPYIGERGNREIFKSIRQKDFGKKYYEKNMDYFYFFIYKSYELLKIGGILSYITTNYFVTADGGKKLRNFIRENFTFKKIINFNIYNIFQEARGQHNMIFFLEKTRMMKSTLLMDFVSDEIAREDLYKLLTNKKADKGVVKAQLTEEELYDHRGHIIIHSYKDERKILDKIKEAKNYYLGQLFNVNQGLVSGADRLSSSWANRLGLEGRAGEGIFVLTRDELEALDLSDYVRDKYVKKFYKNSDIKRYCTLDYKDLHLLYIVDNNLDDLESFPKLHKHLSKYREVLEERREVRRGTRKWYSLQWPREEKIFEDDKIICPQRSIENTFAYMEGPWYASADVYYITRKSKELSLHYLLGVLNSSLMYFWLYYMGKKKGKHLELYASPLKEIPLYYPSSTRVTKKMEKILRHLFKNIYREKRLAEIQDEINQFVFELYGLNKRDQATIVKFIEDRL